MKRGPTYRVSDKIFAPDRRGDGVHRSGAKRRRAVKLSSSARIPGGFRASLCRLEELVGMRLDDDPYWNEVTFLSRRSYRLVAPKRLVALVT